MGGVALGLTVFMGPNRLALTKLLLNAGAKLDTLTDVGTSVLITATSNEDADPDVVKLILNHHHDNLNYKLKARIMK